MRLVWGWSGEVVEFAGRVEMVGGYGRGVFWCYG